MGFGSFFTDQVNKYKNKGKPPKSLEQQLQGANDFQGGTRIPPGTRYTYKLPDNIKSQQPEPVVEPAPQQPIEMPVINQQRPETPAQQFSMADQLQQKQDAGEFKQDFLSGLSPGLGNQLQQNIKDFASGDAMEAQRSANNQALATQIRNMRASLGGQLAGQIGQGGALAGQQMIEQNVLSSMANKGLQEQLQETQMRQQGTQMGMQLAGQQQAAKQFGQNLEMGYQKSALSEKMAEDQNWLQQQGINTDQAQLFGYTDQNGNHVPGSMEIQAQQFQQALNSQAGQSFASYITANKNATINDPAVKNLAQNMWNGMGMEGNVPDWWAEQRIASLRDPKLTNPIIGTMDLIDQAYQSGSLGNMTPEQYEGFKNQFTKMMLGETGAGDMAQQLSTGTAQQQTTTSTGEPTAAQELKQEMTLDQQFANFENQLPTKYTHTNLTPKLWEELELKSPDDYKDWYTNKGGEQYLNVADFVGDIKTISHDASKLAGSYPSFDKFGDPIGMPEDQAIKVKTAITQKTGVEEKEMKKNIEYALDLYKDAPFDVENLFRYTKNETKEQYDAKQRKAVKYIKESNDFTDKQAEDWFNFFKYVKVYKDVRKAYNLDIKFEDKNGFKVKDLEYT